MARKIDEYQPLKFYADKTEPMKNGFRSFAHEGEFFFCRYADGQIVMLSQAYTAKAGRDNGIASVKKNAKLEKRYRFSEVEGGEG